MYRGRFAPSPTGPLHLGSLFAAVASWLDARHSQGEWLLRIEDIDPPREVAGAGDMILRSLEAHGLDWDGPVAYQSHRIPVYRDYLQKLQAMERAYPCTCSRADISAMGGIYDGRCRQAEKPAGGDFAWRFIMPKEVVWQDIFAGEQIAANAVALADPVIWRRDGLVAYQLAVAVDDALMGMSQVVRGRDLLDSTPTQIALLQTLELPLPEYGHLPLILGADGQKLSKQNQASPLLDSEASQSINRVLKLLGQNPPEELGLAPPREQLDWAAANWDRARVPTKQIAPL